MCGRFVSATDADGIVKFFVVDERQAEDLPPNHNVAPTERVYAVTEHEHKRTLVTFRWGLVPHWAKDTKIGNRLINARAESLQDKPAFRDAFARKRCIIPADGFYEWRRGPDGSRVPFYLRADTPIALAGLWDGWKDREAPNGEVLRTCTIITTDANAEASEIHNRMPVVLDPEDWAEWLDRDNDDTAALQQLLRPSPDGLLDVDEVSQDVNDPRTKRPDLVTPVS